MLRSVLAAVVLTLVPPVDGPISRPFDPPARPWGPGHRGVDYRVPPGTSVRAAAGGVVAFAGGVAGGLHVAIDHEGGLRSSYSSLTRVDAARGQRVETGDTVGISGGTGPGHGPDLVHFGLRQDGRYVDPLAFGAAPVRVRLAPVDGEIAPPVCTGTLTPDSASRPRIHTPASHR
ncbi:MAG: murein hydrolase activator EnvC family protein [Acidimicrobiia bacterium]